MVVETSVLTSMHACSEAELYVTRTPPNATVGGGPSATNASPSKVTFSFASQISGGGAGAPIAYSLCLLQPVDSGQVIAFLTLRSAYC